MVGDGLPARGMSLLGIDCLSEGPIASFLVDEDTGFDSSFEGNADGNSPDDACFVADTSGLRGRMVSTFCACVTGGVG